MADGHEVRVLDDMSRGQPDRLRGVACEIVTGDIRDPDIVTYAMHGCQAVAHLAYLNGTGTATGPAVRGEDAMVLRAASAGGSIVLSNDHFERT